MYTRSTAHVVRVVVHTCYMCLYYRFFWSLLVPIPATLAVVTGQNTAEHDRATTCFAPAIVTTPTDITVLAPY